MQIGAERVLAVGDGENDICLLKAAGTSIAFQPKTARVRVAAMHMIQGPLTEVLSVISEEAARLSA
jgi:phosphoserine phosphatase